MLDSIIVTTLTPAAFLWCTAVSLVLGILSAALYQFRNTCSKGFVVTLALLPAIVQVIITLVNGDLGAGVAVAGTFSLVRFRSIPGSAREICSIFLAMAMGLATGMGYLGIAVITFVVLGAVQILLILSPFGEDRTARRELKVTIPEALDYAGIFDDLFAQFARQCELVQVRTTGLGSLYELRYHITLKDLRTEKQLIDAIRCRNGNLDIVCGKIGIGREVL